MEIYKLNGLPYKGDAVVIEYKYFWRIASVMFACGLTIGWLWG